MHVKTRTSMFYRQCGFSLIEVMISLLIMVVGLLGLAGLMVQSQRAEMESYQRAQALILLQDMAGRINANRKAATCYPFTPNLLTSTPFLGTNSTLAAPTVPATQCSTSAILAVYPSMPAATAAIAASTVVADLNAWHNTLLGAAEVMAGNKVGVMIGARGCISYDATKQMVDPVTLAAIPGSGLYTISIAWQGLAPTSANGALLCGQNQYSAENMRRVISMSLRIASLK
jgi:type IV pilus assembly protein PilV